MKHEDDFKHVIRDLGCDLLFAYYYSSEQIHLYQSYYNHERSPKLIIDVTGSVVKQFKKIGMEKSVQFYYKKESFMIKLLVVIVLPQHYLY